MPYSYNEVGAISPGQTIAVPFPYLTQDHVSVQVDGADVDGSLWQWSNSGLLLALVGFPVGTTTRVRRRTPIADRRANLIGAAVFDFDGVNSNDKQLLYALQERYDYELELREHLDDLEENLNTAIDGLEDRVDGFDAVYQDIIEALAFMTNGGISPSRTSLSGYTQGGGVFSPGRVVRVDGFDYQAVPGATAIPDIPGMVPFGEINIKHFGARCDLTWDVVTQGYRRLGGTSDLVAIQLAMAYAKFIGNTRVRISAHTFVDGQVDLVPGITLFGDRNYGIFLWVRTPNEASGLWMDGTDIGGGATGFSYIHQADYIGTKIGGGHIGNAIVVGNFFTTRAQYLNRRCLFDVLLCRAANISGQNSRANILVNCIGWTEKNTFRLGLHGKSNVGSNAVFQNHWGGEYDPLDPTVVGGQYASNTPILHSWHGIGNRVEWLTELDGPAHRLGVAWVTSSVGGLRMGACRGYGIAQPFQCYPGDNSDAFTVASQKNRVGRDNKVGYQHFTEIDPSAATQAVIMLSRATSKFEFYPGTSVLRVRQLRESWKFEGIHLEALPDSDSVTSGIRTFGVRGNWDLGDCTVLGFRKSAMENEFSVADVKINLVESDSCIRWEFCRGGDITTSARIGNAESFDDEDSGTVGETGTGQRGWGADNCSVYSFGGTTEDYTLNGSHSQYATELTLNEPVVTTIHAGMPITVNGHPMTTTDMSYAGSLTLYVTPLPANVASGEDVVVDWTCQIDRIVSKSESSEYGVYLNNTLLKYGDISDQKFSGRYAIWLDGRSMATLHGRLPDDVGSIGSTNYTAKISESSVLICDGMVIPKAPPRVTKHFFVQNVSATDYGRLILRDCLMEDDTLDNLYDSVWPSRQVRMRGCFLKNGRTVHHPEMRGGDNTVGWWYMSEDGRLRMNLRGVFTDASGNFSWTLPKTLASTGSAIVHAQGLSSSVRAIVTCTNPDANTVTAKATDPAGANLAGIAISISVEGYWV